MKRRNLLVLCCLAWLSGLADVVHVFEQSEAGDETVQIADRMLDTGRNYKTGAAPAKSGWVFTHWTISTAQDFADRDAWGGHTTKRRSSFMKRRRSPPTICRRRKMKTATGWRMATRFTGTAI